jgi:hypothetical protein
MSVVEAPHAIPARDVDIYHDQDETEKAFSEKPVPVDDPFGNEESGEVKYRVMKWW